MAFIHDTIVVPSGRDADAGPDPITAGELARAVEFSKHADNPSAGADLQKIALEMGIDWQTLQDTGFEEDNEET
jgi:hypothetical protein